MKKPIVCGLLFSSLLMSTANAEILMKWQKKPLPIDLQTNKERIVFVDKNVKVGFPASLNKKIRIQSTGGAVYFKALEAFPLTRFQLRDMATGELILLDVEAKDKQSNPEEPIRFIYDKELSNKTIPGSQDSDHNDGYSENIRPQLPIPAALTRYAAQMLYAPLRTVEPLAGVQKVASKLPSKITTLLPAYSITTNPLISWKLDDYVVTAIRLQNRSQSRIDLDPRELQGRFYAATFQHNWLGGYGSTEDTTTLYLVTEGFADKAVIPEYRKYKPRKIKRTTKVVKKIIKVTARQ
ncbi:TIGR03749 family integrating conjugative element protein [Phocoenobacter skyensis]|uniref:TIGR03749 family integrating conjugative element protein n=1 Tax=Phocoenobacter skyensis TaxID=97481 RepID=UPI002750FDE2|nr:TIGR03749 family integrating conjugative element protein [Pasteurella skyensis]MDP8185320.1 TIGR03749 family integrating conjugative element protein [Pasteurella skyensis]